MPNFDNFLKSYKRKGNVSITHTRIPCKDKAHGKCVYAGSYHVPTDELTKFHDRYFKAIFCFLKNLHPMIIFLKITFWKREEVFHSDRRSKL